MLAAVCLLYVPLQKESGKAELKERRENKTEKIFKYGQVPNNWDYHINNRSCSVET